MAVYLIHLDKPIGHARHYIGYSKDPRARLKRHRAGRGGRLLAVAAKRGIYFDIVRVWPDAGQAWERRLKRQNNASRLCPACLGKRGQ